MYVQISALTLSRTIYAQAVTLRRTSFYTGSISIGNTHINSPKVQYSKPLKLKRSTECENACVDQILHISR